MSRKASGFYFFKFYGVSRDTLPTLAGFVLELSWPLTLLATALIKGDRVGTSTLAASIFPFEMCINSKEEMKREAALEWNEMISEQLCDNFITQLLKEEKIHLSIFAL